MQGGAAGSEVQTAKPAKGWENSLNPGDTVAGVLVSGDMSVSGVGTVTYNDGKRVLAFGHPFFNLGPVDMPMAKGEVVMTLASAFQPNKMANCHRGGRRAAPGPPQRHHGRARATSRR